MANAVLVSSVKATVGNAVLISAISTTATPPTSNAVLVSSIKASATPPVGNAVLVSSLKAVAAQTPAADAGPDLGPVPSLSTVQLTSAASTMSPTSVAWAITSGGGTLSSTTAANPTLKVPATVAGTTVVVQLRVGTTAADSVPDFVQVAVRAHQLWARLADGSLVAATLNARV